MTRSPPAVCLPCPTRGNHTRDITPAESTLFRKCKREAGETHSAKLTTLLEPRGIHCGYETSLQRPKIQLGQHASWMLYCGTCPLPCLQRQIRPQNTYVAKKSQAQRRVSAKLRLLSGIPGLAPGSPAALNPGSAASRLTSRVWVSPLGRTAPCAALGLCVKFCVS